MKRILALISGIMLLTISTTSSEYLPTTSDAKIVKDFQNKLEKINNDNIFTNLISKIESIKISSPQNNYIIWEISNYISWKLNTKTLTGSIFTWTVTKVIDWDTIQILIAGKKQVIRMIWIDSPESYSTRYGYIECFWKESSKYIKDLIEWKTIQIKTDSTQDKFDKYQRLLGYVLLNWENINQKMIADWYAWEYTYAIAYKYQSEFKSAQKSASESKNWLWAQNMCNWERKAVKNTIKLQAKDPIKIKEDASMSEKNKSTYSCEVKKTTCSQMISCQEAYFYLNSCSIKTLDADKDWVPCESVCG